MEIIEKELYSEVYSILNMLGKSYIDKLPKELYKLVESNKLNSYAPVIESLEDLNNKNLHKESISMIILFYMNYWCESEEEKRNMRQILETNYITNENEKREKYNVDNIFKNKIKEQNSDENTYLIKYKKNFFIKILEKIKKIFSI